MSTRIYAAAGIQKFFRKWNGAINNPSTVINSAIERYNYLLVSNLPNFSVEEWGILFDLISEKLPVPINHLHSLNKSLIQDINHNEEMVAKWELDEDSLIEKLFSLNPAETISMLDAAERYLTTNVFEGVGLPLKSAVLQ